MQKFDIPLTDREPKATPAPETPSKRKAFSMMEAKPVPRPEPYGAGPRETPAQETPSARRRSSRLETQTETEEVKHVASLRRSVSNEVSHRPSNEVDKLQAKIKSLRGRVGTIIGHSVTGKTAEEIKSNITLGDRFGAWLGKITGKKTDSSSLNELLDQLKLAEKTLEVKLTPDISVVRPGSIARKPRTLRSIKSRIEELETRQASQAEKALDEVHIEVVEPEAPPESLAARIEAAKARSIAEQVATTKKPRTLRTRIKEIETKQSDEADKALENIHVEVVEEKPAVKKPNIGERIERAQVKSKTLGAEDIIPEIKTSPLAESVRMPEEESMEVDLSELNEGASEPELLQKTHFEGLIDGDLANTDIIQPGTPLYEFRGQGKVYEKLTELGELIKGEDERVNHLQTEIDALDKELETLSDQLRKKTTKKIRQTAQEKAEEIRKQIQAKQEELENNGVFLSQHDSLLAEARAIAEKLEESSLERLEPVEESVSKKAPPPPSAEKRKRAETPAIEVGEGELTPEEMKAAYGEEDVKFEDTLSPQGKKILTAFIEHRTKEEEIERAGWFKGVVRDHPLIAKHADNAAMVPILKNLQNDISVFDARRDGIIERAKGKFSKKIIQELRDLSVERSEMVNHATDELEAVANRLEKPSAPKKEKALSLRTKEKADPYHNLRQELTERVKDEEQIEDYIGLASKRDKAYKENDEQAAAALQKRINLINATWRDQGILGDNEDPSVATTGKSGIGRMGVIGSDLASKRVQRGKYEGDVHSGAREKTRSKLEKTARLETKELQPFNTAWAIEKLGAGAAKRWDLVAPIIMEAKLGATIEREVSDMLKKIENLPNFKKDRFSDEYRDLPQMMDIVRHTERFNQSPETAAYIFLRALSPADFADDFAQDIVESTLSKLDTEIAKAEKEIARQKEQEGQDFSMMRAKPKFGETKASTVKSEAPKAKKARTIRAQGKNKAA
ncbi:MAG: hypothetical protein WC750_04075 [Patescibacteria group bacterium]|jgi:hypothetical protein